MSVSSSRPAEGLELCYPPQAIFKCYFIVFAETVGIKEALNGGPPINPEQFEFMKVYLNISTRAAFALLSRNEMQPPPPPQGFELAPSLTMTEQNSCGVAAEGKKSAKRKRTTKTESGIVHVC